LSWSAKREPAQSRPRLLLTRKVEAGAQAEIAAWAELQLSEAPAPAELLQQLQRSEAAITMLTDRLDAQVFAALQGSPLKIIANHAVGHDNIDLQAASAAGIWVTNTPDVLTNATAEMAWALLLSLARRVVEGDQLVRSGGWRGWEPTQLLGMSIFGKTLGIVGAGRIGQAMALMGQGFGLKLLYFSRQPKPEFEAATGAIYTPLAALCEQAELISVHLPGGAETHHLIDANLLARMQPQTLLVNTGRGSSLDEAALTAALQAGQLAGAALDVYEYEPQVSSALRALPNVVLAPHLGSATVATRRAMALCCLRNIQTLWAGQQPLNPLNSPDNKSKPGGG